MIANTKAKAKAVQIHKFLTTHKPIKWRGNIVANPKLKIFETTFQTPDYKTIGAENQTLASLFSMFA